MTDEPSDEVATPTSHIEQTAEIFKLNNDCLECIFERLQDLRSEVAFAQACERFQWICLSRWRSSHAYDHMDLEKWRLLLPEYEDLCYFTQQMRPYIRQITESACLCTLLKDFDDMQIHVLPNVTSFYYVPDDMDCCPSERSIRKMAKIMPNLLQLRLTTALHGRYLSNFRHLQELHLYEDQHKAYELQQEYLDEICCQLTNLQVLDIRMYDAISILRLNNCVDYLKNLRILKLNLATLKSVLHEVLKLPALKQLVVLLDTEWYIPSTASVDSYDHKIREVREFYEIMERKAPDIKAFAVDGYYMPLEPGWDAVLPIWPYRKLQRLAICSWTHRIDFLERYTCMTNLQLLCLRNWTFLCDDMLIKFIKLCPHLQHLDVSYCRELTPNFLHLALNILKQREPNKQRCGYIRTPPVLLYYVLSGFEDYVDQKGLKTAPEYKDYITFMDAFPVSSERGLSFVDRGYQFDFE
ncbi:CG7148 [Drosophila busckii]|uniref:CG7148 n=1 Tax=Drosophila busckii TaxID=30019 RepID=A0A0M3QWX7_DROBS|nr:uncharacterized protein LOC108598847 [Drosophila busckii]ALC44943.1 CG7148 [Drosophila busckii]